MNRHLSRMVTMQAIFEANFRPEADRSEIISRSVAEFADDVDKEYILSTSNQVLEKKAELDEEIAKSAPEWPIEQISPIDKAILELAIYELLYSSDVPSKVSINEAVELAKQFGSENSSKFVNGVLGSVYDKHEKEIDKKEKNIQVEK